MSICDKNSYISGIMDDTKVIYKRSLGYINSNLGHKQKHLIYGCS